MTKGTATADGAADATHQASRRAIPAWLRPFARITSSGTYVGEIDGMRFLAIASVAFFHLCGTMTARGAARYDPIEPWLDAFQREGHYGVQLFFLISGFVLALPFASHYLLGKRSVSLASYYMRRLTRLEPPYFFNLIVLYALLVLVKHADARELLPHLGASMAYQHNVFYGGVSRINGVAWSLEIEIQFYVAMPLLARVFAIESARLRRGVLLGSMIAAGVLQTIFFAKESPTTLSILYFVQYFLAGFVLADVYLVDWKRAPEHHLLWDLFGALAIVVMFTVAHRNLYPRVIFPLASLVFAFAVFRGELFRWVLTRPLITTIGGMCYTIYLFHYPIIAVAYRITEHAPIGRTFWPNAVVQSLLVTPMVLAVTGVLFLALEKPCMDPTWPRKVAARFRGAVTPDQSGG